MGPAAVGKIGAGGAGELESNGDSLAVGKGPGDFQNHPLSAASNLMGSVLGADLDHEDSAVGSVQSVAASATSNGPSFTSVYQQNFSQWDDLSGGKGYLTQTDLDTLLQDPDIQGSDAAALATVKGFSDQGFSKGDKVLFNAQGAQLDPKSGSAQTISLVGDAAASNGDDFQGAFERSQAKIADQSFDLFSNGAPDPQALKQGNSGDCYFESSLSCLAKANPDAIKKMVTDNGDGSYNVQFPGANHAVKVTEPTDAELAVFGSSGKDGMWGSVLGKAFGQLREDDGNVAKADPDKDDIEPFEGANGGGLPGKAIETLTGNKAAHVKFPPSADDRKDLPDALMNAQNNGRIVVASTLPGKGGDSEHEADGLPHNHAISVMGFDPQAQEVTLRNPWGSNGKDNQFAPKDGTLIGDDTGVFTMSLDKFYKNFNGVSIQTASPANGQGY